jgi:hypothetical protein
VDICQVVTCISIDYVNQRYAGKCHFVCRFFGIEVSCGFTVDLRVNTPCSKVLITEYI